MKAVSLLLLLISAATAMRVPRRIAASGLAAAGVACLARRPAHAMASFQAMADALGYFPVQVVGRHAVPLDGEVALNAL